MSALPIHAHPVTTAVTVLAAAIDKIQPTKDFPGADLLANILSWGMYLALALSVASILFGAGSWTWSRWGNSGYAVSGKNWVLGGITGALLSGLAVTIVNRLFESAGK
jgi:hypothetical protein